MPTAAYMRKYRAKQRGVGRRAVKFPDALLCECGKRALYIADVEQLSAEGHVQRVTFPVCYGCRSHFRTGELTALSVVITLDAMDYYNLLDHISAMNVVAHQALGWGNQTQMEAATERTQAALNLLQRVVRIK